MIDIIIDTLIDALKLLPFLFLTFLFIEFLEHKINNKKIIANTKTGPFVGSLLGSIPQCGFSVSATNLYSMRIISLGTLISIYLSTSDEMLPILLSNGTNISFILKIILIKVLIGMIAGFIIDLFLRKNEKPIIKDFCEEHHCHCEKGILVSSLKHTLSVLIFIIIISFILNIMLSYLGEDILAKIFMKQKLTGPFVASLIGLIPNCAASVLLTELFLNTSITYGSMIAGLLTGSGVALLTLFKVNKNIKENIKIVLLIYFIGSISGIIIDIITLST